MAIERNPILCKTDWAEGSKPLPNLPNEINVEILLRLPVKSLLRFRCACKSWRSLISDPKFVKTHLSLASSNIGYTHHRVLLRTTYFHRDFKSCSISSIMRHEQSDTAVSVDCPFVESPNGFWIEGYDKFTDDYKLVLVFNGGSNTDYRRNKVVVYAIRADSRRRLADCPHSIPKAGKGKFVSGALHWTVSDGSNELIVSLDLAKETYGEVSQPDYNRDGFLSTFDVLSGYLCMLCKYPRARVDLWVMKEYGKRESWTKLVAIHDVTHPLYGEYFTPSCILNNGDMLMVVKACLVRYSPNDGTFSYPKIHGFFPYCDAYPYIESLVSP
ncbi:hypothetical protein RHMOL_Rhmol02G0062000 [Rhododendron molle]|uniref:Uncharacterized protein n=1 Tax=Rhododendron molle TaxID=49168 RepID=A0ACC0PLT8_RHOML|nr:hypothetical protein RHMOL_Rhmol02G0062000 [Rhododendron molle]